MTTTTIHTMIGQLALQYCKKRLPLMVMRSAAGYYIGTCSDEGPCSRESTGYYRHQADAQHALDAGEWNQRDHP
ncbi:hypothetical protein [Rhodoferax antarcticus]|uniref:Uncharacterized protein n=1 Tax=Rhodoferax antarcticus ANT.BR TaxID=1111071 RepID=A0A1Q8Y961_9BURK|nr:hypothetical protein [Rhodoferax antarcticus]OLP04538.1 hypothetical protein BLL52_4107 [Rhodoferax antarcticus ANT.BR]